MQQTVPESGPEFLNNSQEPQSRQKNRLVLSPLLSSLRFLDPLHREEETENQPSRRRKQEPIDCLQERGSRQMERWANRERIQRERGGSVEWVEKRRRKGMGGGKFVKREREKDREEERVGW